METNETATVMDTKVAQRAGGSDRNGRAVAETKMVG
jgi:hypothetical protein